MLCIRDNCSKNEVRTQTVDYKLYIFVTSKIMLKMLTAIVAILFQLKNNLQSEKAVIPWINEAFVMTEACVSEPQVHDTYDLLFICGMWVIWVMHLCIHVITAVRIWNIPINRPVCGSNGQPGKSAD